MLSSKHVGHVRRDYQQGTELRLAVDDLKTSSLTLEQMHRRVPRWLDSNLVFDHAGAKLEHTYLILNAALHSAVERRYGHLF